MRQHRRVIQLDTRGLVSQRIDSDARSAYAGGVHSVDALMPFARAAAASGHPFAWLDSRLGSGATPHGRSYLILGGVDTPGEQLTYSVTTGVTHVRSVDGTVNHTQRSVFDELRDRWAPTSISVLHDADSQTLAFAGGWVGWFGYGCAADTLSLDPAIVGAIDVPDAWWLRAGSWLCWNHQTGEVTEHGTPGLLDWLNGVEVSAAAEVPRGEPPKWRDSRHAYLRNIAAAQDRIAAGDAYQLCVTTTVSGQGAIDAFEVYSDLRSRSGSHHGAFVRGGGVDIASITPELFLTISPGGTMTTKPIKGTRPRSDDVERDQMNRSELRASAKECAENTMIVDLMRNDLGRVAKIGSVAVPSLLEVESYPTVHQLVSTVTAALDSQHHRIDAIRSVFPTGSMTGAPKISSVRILSDIEGGPRGVYSGALGYLSNDGSVDLAVVIRTLVATSDGWSIGTGGGITALSVPTEEVDEVALKARALLAALGWDSAPSDSI